MPSWRRRRAETTRLPTELRKLGRRNRWSWNRRSWNRRIRKRGVRNGGIRKRRSLHDVVAGWNLKRGGRRFGSYRNLARIGVDAKATRHLRQHGQVQRRTRPDLQNLGYIRPRRELRY